MRETTQANGLLASLRQLPDHELLRRLKSLATRERRATALLVAHVAEFDTRDVYLRAGYPSLFAYCRDVLALSEHEALNRIDAARTARRFPLILDLLAAGEVNLTTIRLLGPHLTAENHRAVLESARGKRKAEIEEIVARLSPRADVPPSVRRLPELGTVLRAAATPALAVEPAPRGEDHSATGALTCLSTGVAVPSASDRAAAAVRADGRVSEAHAASASSPHPRRSAEVTPLSPDRYKYQLTIGGSTLEKLRLAKDMLRHALPSGDDEAILDRALTALLTELARKKFGGERKTGSSDTATGASRNAAPGSDDVEATDSRRVPVEVKRAVWVRDLGRCAFVAADARRCGERAFVEFHHVRPYAAGGKPTVDNIQLRCWRHNGYEARVFFTREPVDEGQRREQPGHSTRVPGAPSLRGRSGTSDAHRGGRTGTTRRDMQAIRECTA